MAEKIPIKICVPISDELKKTRDRIGERAFREWIDDLFSGNEGWEHLSTHIDDREVIINYRVPNQEIYSA